MSAAQGPLTSAYCQMYSRAEPGGFQAQRYFTKMAQPTAILTGKKSKPAPPDLICINVFDSSCATVYVDRENKIVYMPLGLDVFDKLAKACDDIKASLF